MNLIGLVGKSRLGLRLVDRDGDGDEMGVVLSMVVLGVVVVVGGLVILRCVHVILVL